MAIDDICDRLRKVSANPIYLTGVPGTTPGNVLAKEAAGEIERMRAENQRLRGALTAVRDDLIQRAEPDLHGTPVVAVGQGVWLRICDALKGLPHD